ncbi:hypothetical protein [Amycolatopsis circi]|uniref:non-homologous end-joining DNA ligase LigD n=1 Tax=Amycolatopsis circi TaxID=871959 RepID=UPI0031345625
MAGRTITVQVGQRRLALSNLVKCLYGDGCTKGEVVRYYTNIAPVLLPHLHGRPTAFVRWPDGTAGDAFFEKDCPPVPRTGSGPSSCRARVRGSALRSPLP